MTDQPPPQRLSLWRRLLLFFLLEWLVAPAVLLLLQSLPGLPYLALIVLGSALLGLVSGLGTRFMLKELHWILSSLVTLAALFSGLFILGIASASRFGLGLQEFQTFDLAGATQAATALLACLFSATAWRNSSRSKPEPAANPPSQPPPSRKHSPAKSKRPAARRKPQKAASPRPRSRSIPASEPAASVGARLVPAQAGARPVPADVGAGLVPADVGAGLVPAQISARLVPAQAVARLVPAQAQKPPHPFPSRLKKKRRPEVQFAPTQEHRCPYCLEIVQPNDPRGIVECKICHTLHHADCWAITGTCQVPHLNA